MKKIEIIILLLIILIVVFYLFYKEGSLAVNKYDKTTKIFVIKRGEKITQISRNLEKEDLIRNKIVFYLIIKKNNLSQKIQAGDFRLSPAMTAEEIALTLTKGTLDVWITIIEGLRKEEVAQVISRELPIPATELVKNSQEGYLFPDTYLIPKNVTLDLLLSIFNNNFQKKLDLAFKQRTASNDLSSEEIITLASLIEKEARTGKNKQIVASILYKRYKNNWPLQVDATVQYALGYQISQKTWWKKDLTNSDLDVNSPFNTYINTGLPPTPICNPGLTSIIAAMNAVVNTPYWFYLSSKDGSTMHYAATIEEHNENIRKYLKIENY